MPCSYVLYIAIVQYNQLIDIIMNDFNIMQLFLRNMHENMLHGGGGGGVLLG